MIVSRRRDLALTDKGSGMGPMRQNGLMVKATDCPVCSRPNEITGGRNAGQIKTRLSSCEEFRNMWVLERSTAMEDAQTCVRCLEWTHEKNDFDAKYETKHWQDCTLLDGAGKKFGKRHHSLLHGRTMSTFVTC